MPELTLHADRVEAALGEMRPVGVTKVMEGQLRQPRRIEIRQHQLERELAYRVSGGIEVALSWDTLTNDLTVCVSDRCTGKYFELDADPEHALDIFEHPYAYAGLPR